MTALLLPLAGRIQSDLSPDRMLVENDLAEQLRREIREEFGSDWDAVVVLFEADGWIVSPDRLMAFRRLGRKIDAMDNVVRVLHPANVETARGSGDLVEVREVFYPVPEGSELVERLEYARNHPLLKGRLLSADGTTAGLVIEIDDPALPRVAPLVEAVMRLIDAEPAFQDIHAYPSGLPAVNLAYTQLVTSSQAYVLPLVMLVIAATLGLAFRAASGVYPTFLAIALGLVWTYALMHATGQAISLLGTMIPVFALTLGASQAIHLTTAYGAARGAGGEPPGAVAEMFRTAGVGCVAAAVTTAAGLLSLGLARVNLIREYGLSCGIAIACVFAASLAVVPPLLALHRRAPRPLTEVAALGGRLWAVAGWSARNARGVLVASGLLVALAAFLALRVETNLFIKGEVDSGHPIERAITLSERKLSGIGGFVVSFRADDEQLLDPEVLGSIDRLQRDLEARPEVLRTISLVDYMKDVRRALNEDRPEAARPPESREEAAQLLLLLESGDDNGEVERLLSFDRSWSLVRVHTGDIGNRGFLALEQWTWDRVRNDSPRGVDVEIGSGSLVWARAEFQTVRDLLTAFALASAVIFGVMLAVLRSLRLALLALVPNLVPTVVCLAYMGASGVLLRVGTAVCFTVALGIAVDDTIHYMVRYRRELDRSPSGDGALRRTTLAVGPPILLTSVILAAGFALYGLSPFKTLRELGALMALALSTAALADLIVLPALLSASRRTPARSDA